WTDRFVQGLLARGVRGGALEAIEEHRRAGDILVLLSASPDLYVPIIAQRLGFTQAICTGVRWIGERLDGELVTPNRRGDEKTRCLEALRRQHPGLATVAYANGPADLDHLELCDHRLLVNGTLWTRRRAARRGIPCAHWR